MLPIGGLKEKVLAAHRGLVNRVIIPEDNMKDIEEIPKRILKKVELLPVAHMDDVLKKALVLTEGEEFFAPQDQCEPFCLDALQEQKPPVPDEVTAH